MTQSKPELPIDTIKTYEAAWLDAQSTLLREWRTLTDRARRKLLRTHKDLAQLLDQLDEQHQDYTDFVNLSLTQLHQDAKEFEHKHVCCAQVFGEDGSWTWWSLPEVTSTFTSDAMVHFTTELAEERMLVRSWPVGSVGEIRNVPIDHPWLETTTEFTLANQGQPFITPETLAIQLQESGIDGRVPLDVTKPNLMTCPRIPCTWQTWHDDNQVVLADYEEHKAWHAKNPPKFSTSEH